ncbi:hypothetical protein JQ582_23940 [Bradyrhizobium japonicum]|jgi:hypothetical protein|nr:hypothetical protein [Bradyrhizobium japonicum]MBR0746986.1 hypothetical protein [Bradyrhizobium japonicum]MCP1763304.1 hypothetical protein [Bradyrhizobium japonicum]MCP1785438.1 hypothetical protein [Bradyrhizobium japonicum]MCP1807320.1 hypothetical protein [Bradyrhizobium japonicum]MCP1816244.1 hypothetical protein [Bradyrhizobium japonicum]
MADENCLSTSTHHTPWNKGKLIGAKPPLRPNQVLVDPNPAIDRETVA